LKWNGIPLFHVEAFSRDFSGRLYFFLGQGLGDHVNGFRVLHEVMSRFPEATPVVYADLRWEELVRKIDGIEIRWYQKAMDVLSKTGTNNPYDLAYREVRKDVASFPGHVFLAYSHFPMPDRQARNETTLESTARSIGLVLRETARPFLPVLPSDLEWAQKYLIKHGLEKKCYAIIAPYSWPNKIWGKENFQKLIDEIREKWGFRTIVVSYPEIGLFDNKGAVCAFDLTLGQISGLMSFAGLYVGLDSGPSHMAASFHLPMVVIFIEKRTTPFEVRPLSPRALYVVESFFSDVPAPGVRTVCDAVAFLDSLSKNDDEVLCPVCHRGMNYVVESKIGMVRLMRACGLSVDMELERTSHPDDTPPSVPLKDSCTLLLDSERDLGTFDRVSHFKENLERMIPDSFGVLLEKSKNPIKEAGRLKWSIDSLVTLMQAEKCNLTGCRVLSGKIHLFFEKNSRSRKKEKWVELSWGKTLLSVSSTRYLRWYTYEMWGTRESLVGIVKAQAELGLDPRERLICAWIAFRAEKKLRSFRWLVKSAYSALLGK